MDLIYKPELRGVGVGGVAWDQAASFQWQHPLPCHLPWFCSHALTDCSCQHFSAKGLLLVIKTYDRLGPDWSSFVEPNEEFGFRVFDF